MTSEGRPQAGVPAATHDLSVVLPYFNEADFLPRTLSSLLQQSRPPDRLILVDNGSTDGSARVCRELLAGVADIRITHLHEPKPGKIHALHMGCSALETEYVATCDADTYYPPHYIELCIEMFRRVPRGVVALMALPARGGLDGARSRRHRRLLVLASKVFRRCTFTGGYGQVFRTASLRACGGFSVDYWSHVLLDHEVMQRLFRHGRAQYHVDLWCVPSNRRNDRPGSRWTVGERALYFLTPWALKDWYFYRFLGPRLERRGLSQLTLRRQPWRTSTSGE